MVWLASRPTTINNGSSDQQQRRNGSLRHRRARHTTSSTMVVAQRLVHQQQQQQHLRHHHQLQKKNLRAEAAAAQDLAKVSKKHLDEDSCLQCKGRLSKATKATYDRNRKTSWRHRRPSPPPTVPTVLRSSKTLTSWILYCKICPMQDSASTMKLAASEWKRFSNIRHRVSRAVAR